MSEICNNLENDSENEQRTMLLNLENRVKTLRKKLKNTANEDTAVKYKITTLALISGQAILII